MAYKSMKYELCNLKAECTNLVMEFMTIVFLDVNKLINLSLVEHQIEGELSQASDRTGKVPQTMLHPTRKDTFKIMQLYRGCSPFHLCLSCIMAYGSTPYVGMVPKKMAATLKVRK